MQQPTFDPGLTQKFTGQVRRFINKDGSFNVRRKGAPWRSVHPYLRLINMSWPAFLATIFFSYLVVNLIFAGAYFLLGVRQIQGAEAPSPFDRLLNDFFFSAQTLSTVGYGVM